MQKIIFIVVLFFKRFYVIVFYIFSILNYDLFLLSRELRINNLFNLVSTKQIRFIWIWIIIWNFDITSPFSVHQCIKLGDFIPPTNKLETPQRILCCHGAQLGGPIIQGRPLRWFFLCVCNLSSISALHRRVIKLKVFNLKSEVLLTHITMFAGQWNFKIMGIFFWIAIKMAKWGL